MEANFFDNGFNLSEPDDEVTTLALVSLKTALRAFFTTYANVRPYWSSITKESEIPQEEADQTYRRSSYYENYVEAIVHFQHFAELSCLDLLRREHPLLTTSKSNDHVNLWKSIRDVNPDWNAIKKRGTANFETILWRLQTLIAVTEINLGEGTLTFFDDKQRDNLIKLREQRDHLLHRGVFILRYDALDQFIGQYILPFVIGITNLPFYSTKNYLWRYKKLACKRKDGAIVDPLNSIFEVFSKGYDPKEVALYKEMGRAAYRNPLPQASQLKGFGSSTYRQIRPQAEKRAQSLALEYEAWDIRKCPVCDIKTLLLYGEIEVEGDDPLSPEKIYHFTNAAECTCCGFSIDKSIKNLKEYNIDEDDYWLPRE